eukprot:CAMPEP_0202447994 /NCGR_PEP_ID=MMETSP1360-20130828/6782_1 /ASSEMBLY_ACC=CAM_ASM_000848 /TAXON_ID=515479 /ORGANISM="Licmophora paradoxa, Strain CCMP2313" /LENGTH=90 /DNA_ID=CAMNT_0049065349 /DNA_START=79 /DNA_END=351 /DNA_ORIENTATION=+
MPRADGKKLVAVATGAIVLTVGIAQVYLPYWMDRDKLRGMSEEEDMPQAAKQEMERMMRIQQATNTMQHQQQQQQREGGNAGSMWNKMKK